MDIKTKQNLIRLAQKEADKAVKKGNSPFGAVLTNSQGNIIAKAHNTQRSSNNPTAHAEINLLRKAGKKLNTMFLNGLRLFSNAESCSMCMSASVKRKIRHYYFGAPCEKSMDPFITPFDIAKKSKIKLHIETGILKNECVKQIRIARREKRKRNKLSKK